MKSHIRHVGFVSAFFHVTSRFQGLSVLSHVSALSLLWLMCSSIWMGHIMPVRSSVDGHLGYFHLLATVRQWVLPWTFACMWMFAFVSPSGLLVVKDMECGGFSLTLSRMILLACWSRKIIIEINHHSHLMSCPLETQIHIQCWESASEATSGQSSPLLRTAQAENDG